MMLHEMNYNGELTGQPALREMWDLSPIPL